MLYDNFLKIFDNGILSGMKKTVDASDVYVFPDEISLQLNKKLEMDQINNFTMPNTHNIIEDYFGVYQIIDRMDGVGIDTLRHFALYMEDENDSRKAYITFGNIYAVQQIEGIESHKILGNVSAGFFLLDNVIDLEMSDDMLSEFSHFVITKILSTLATLIRVDKNLPQFMLKNRKGN